MSDAGKWLARDRGAFDSEPVNPTSERKSEVQATAELQDFLTKDECDWMKALFLRLAR